MRLDVITLFPEFVDTITDYGITGRAASNNLFELHTWNPREQAQNRHNNVDARAYGGGPGMVMQVGPLKRSLERIRSARRHSNNQNDNDNAPVIYLSPQGELFNQAYARDLAQGPGAILVSGRYEGIDQRFLDTEVDLELSVGDFVLSGGELPAMLVIDAIARLLPGALGDAESAVQDSFSEGLFDHPHYTRPEQDEAGNVPPVLLSGDHAAINRWRLKQALGNTWLRRPTLLDTLELTPEQAQLLREFIAEI